MGAKCYQFATKLLTERARADLWGISPISLFVSLVSSGFLDCELHCRVVPTRIHGLEDFASTGTAYATIRGERRNKFHLHWRFRRNRRCQFKKVKNILLLSVSPPPTLLLQLAHAPFVEALVRSDRSVVLFPTQLAFGKSGSSSTTRGFEKEVTSTPIYCSRQIVLGDPAAALAGMEAGADSRPT